MKTLKSLTESDIKYVYGVNIQYFGRLTCYLCHEPIIHNDDNLEHKTPVHRGGNNDLANLDVAHSLCNKSKGFCTAEEYWAEKGFPAPQVKPIKELMEL